MEKSRNDTNTVLPARQEKGGEEADRLLRNRTQQPEDGDFLYAFRADNKPHVGAMTMKTWAIGDEGIGPEVRGDGGSLSCPLLVGLDFPVLRQ